MLVINLYYYFTNYYTNTYSVIFVEDKRSQCVSKTHLDEQHIFCPWFPSLH